MKRLSLQLITILAVICAAPKFSFADSNSDCKDLKQQVLDLTRQVESLRNRGPRNQQTPQDRIRLNNPNFPSRGTGNNPRDGSASNMAGANDELMDLQSDLAKAKDDYRLCMSEAQSGDPSSSRRTPTEKPSATPDKGSQAPPSDGQNEGGDFDKF